MYSEKEVIQENDLSREHVRLGKSKDAKFPEIEYLVSKFDYNLPRGSDESIKFLQLV